MESLQSLYPLSPRKFWKKIIPMFFGASFLTLLIGSCVAIFKFSFSKTAFYDLMDPLFLLGMFLGYIAIIYLYAWYITVYIRRYYYSASDNFLTIKKGVFAPQEIHVQYGKIQDVYVDQDVFDRVMGLYDVHVASATVSSAMEAHIDGVEYDAAEGLKSLLLQKIQGSQTSFANNILPPLTQETPTRLNEEVSSRNYPLTETWLFLSILSTFFSTLFLATFFSLWLTTGDGFPASLFSPPPLLTWAVLFIVIFILRVIYLFIWRAVYHFEFLPDYILMRTGVISRSDVHIPYRTIQDVNIKQSIMERLSGLATVVLENAAPAQVVGKQIIKPGITIPGQTLEKAGRIAEIVRKIILTKNSSQTGV